MIPPVKAQDPSLAALEALRGYAAIVVVFHHFTRAFMPEFQNYMTWGVQSYTFGWLLNGVGAVYLFFILSGFVLTVKYFQNPASEQLILAALKRLPRLWPAAAYGVALGYLALRFAGTPYAAAGAASGSAWLANFGFYDYSAQVSLLDAVKESFQLFVLDQRLTYNTNLWTMVLEFYGSLVAFFAAYVLVFVLGDARITLQKVALLTCVVLATSLIREWLGLGFIIGVGLAYLYARKIYLPKPAAQAFILLGLMLLGSHWQTRSMLGGALLVWGITTPAATPRAFVSGFGQLIGRWSFPIYITHSLVICTAAAWAYLRLAGQGEVAQLIASFAVTWGLSIGLAYPIVRWESWYLPRLNRFVQSWAGRLAI